MSGFLHCKWCQGRGCLACEGERQQWEKEFFGKPLFSADLNDPHDVELAKSVIHADMIEKAFGPGGGGIGEIEERAALASLRQFLHKAKKEEPDGD